MVTYLIDPNVLMFFLKVEDDQHGLNAYNWYIQKVVVIYEQSLREFLKSYSFEDNEIKEVLNDLTTHVKKQDKFIKDQEELTSQETSQKLHLYVSHPSFIKMLENVVNHFNKFIYDTYVPKLSPDQKQRLNEYIDGIEKSLKESVKVMEETYFNENNQPSTLSNADTSNSDQSSGSSAINITANEAPKKEYLPSPPIKLT